MATFENFAPAEHRVPRFGLLPGLAAAAAHLVRRHRERRALVKLSRLEPRTLRDMGFEPAEIYGALEGTWDEVPGDRWRGFGPE